MFFVVRTFRWPSTANQPPKAAKMAVLSPLLSLFLRVVVLSPVCASANPRRCKITLSGDESAVMRESWVGANVFQWIPGETRPQSFMRTNRGWFDRRPVSGTPFRRLEGRGIGRLISTQEYSNDFPLRLETRDNWDPEREAQFRAENGLPILPPSPETQSAEARMALLDVENWRGKRLIDLGTGDGQTVLDLRSLGVRAEGLDLVLSPTQRRRSYFHEADIRDTGLDSEAYDIAVSSYNIFHYGGGDDDFYDQALIEIFGILKPGGILIIVGGRHLLVEHVLRYPDFELLSGPPQTWPRQIGNLKAFFRKRVR